MAMTTQEIHERNCAIHEAIEEVCPIHGISFAADDPAAWVIQPKEEATREQIDAAQAVLASFDTVKVFEKTARKKRRDAIAAMDADVVKLLNDLHARTAAIERNTQPADEWRDAVLGDPKARLRETSERPSLEDVDVRTINDGR